MSLALMLPTLTPIARLEISTKPREVVTEVAERQELSLGRALRMAWEGRGTRGPHWQVVVERKERQSGRTSLPGTWCAPPQGLPNIPQCLVFWMKFLEDPPPP